MTYSNDDMFKNTRMLELFNSIKELYPKGDLSPSNGHEISHITGVIMRAEEFSSKLNSSPTTYRSWEPVNKDVVMISAALHDVGNIIDRDDHNLYSKGIVDGKLDLDTIIEHDVDSSFETRLHCLNMIKGRPLSTVLRQDIITDDKKKSLEKAMHQCFKHAVQVKCSFDKAYFGDFKESAFSIGKDVQLANIKETCDNNVRILAKQIKQLRVVTEKLGEIYPIGTPEREEISKACAEHNIDYYDKTQTNPNRFVSKSIISRIVADADKDNCAESFAVRTISYAANKWAGKRPDLFYNPDGTLNKETCCKHVLHQANERFRAPGTELFLESVQETMPDGSVSPIGYKSICSVKGATNIFYDKNGPKGNKLIEWPQAFSSGGDDRFNQIDAAAQSVLTTSADLDAYNKNKAMKLLNSPSLSKLEKWANPENEEQSLKEVGSIFEALVSIEKTVQKAQGIEGRPIKEFSGATTELAIQTIEQQLYDAFKGQRDLTWDNVVGYLNDKHQREDFHSLSSTFEPNDIGKALDQLIEDAKAPSPQLKLEINDKTPEYDMKSILEGYLDTDR